MEELDITFMYSTAELTLTLEPDDYVIEANMKERNGDECSTVTDTKAYLSVVPTLSTCLSPTIIYPPIIQYLMFNRWIVHLLAWLQSSIEHSNHFDSTRRQSS